MIDLIGIAKTVVGPVLAAAVSGFFSWHGGRHEGHAEFISAVEKAASTVMSRLEAQLAIAETRHIECEEKFGDLSDKYASLKNQIDELMSGHIPAYVLDPKGDTFD